MRAMTDEETYTRILLLLNTLRDILAAVLPALDGQSLEDLSSDELVIVPNKKGNEQDLRQITMLPLA